MNNYLFELSEFIYPSLDNPYREDEAQNENYYEGKSVLGKELIGLTINNKTHPISPSDDSPIKITFNHQLYLVTFILDSKLLQYET